MKILYFIGAYRNFTGSQRSMVQLASRLPPQVERIGVFPGEGKAVEGFKKFGVTVKVVPASGALDVFEKGVLRQSKLKQAASFLTDLVPYTLRLVQLIRSEHADIIHCDGARGLLLIGWAAKLAGKPVIWHLRGENILEHYPLLNTLAHKLATEVVTVADALQPAIKEGMPRRTIYNGIDYTDAPPSPEIRGRIEGELKNRNFNFEETFCIATASSLDPYKGLHHLLAALSELCVDDASLHRRVTWFVLGDSSTEPKRKYEAYLRERAAQLGIADNIFWLGWQDDSKGFMQACDAVVLPTIESEEFVYPDGERLHLTCTEGFPRTILEAMVAGKPVIATDVAGVREQVVDNETGYVVPPGDGRALAAALRGLIEAKASDRLQMGQRAAERVRRLFSTERMVSETLKLYDELLENRNGKRQGNTNRDNNQSFNGSSKQNSKSFDKRSEEAGG